MANLFGGGDVQCDRLQIAELELPGAGLERRGESLRDRLFQEVAAWVLANELVGQRLCSRAIPGNPTATDAPGRARHR
ncbi:hypothetical protein [Rubidibacter lacunae]|uniref:hypothetical protein n=1 Tax=Rubidibacter lacunae TaxID=582514 RepID=UPI000409EE9A|nr:hypothetical protein [Rubidibacter lacunae]